MFIIIHPRKGEAQQHINDQHSKTRTKWTLFAHDIQKYFLEMQLIYSREKFNHPQLPIGMRYHGIIERVLYTNTRAYSS